MLIGGTKGGGAQSPPNRRELLQLADGARAAVRGAMRTIEQIRAADGPVGHSDKSDGSPVSEADMASHRFLTERLRALPLRYPAISEEGGGDLQAPQNSPYWLVDPLDGTADFLAGRQDFTVNVALVVDSVVVWGAVGVPADGRIYEGGAGLGTRLWSGPAPQSLTPAPASNRQCRVVVSRAHLEAETEAALQRLERHFDQLIRQPVSAALKFCVLAEGGADCYPRSGRLKHWDLAAGQAVLEGAGGRVLQLADGQPVRYGPDASALVPPFVAFADPTTDWHTLLTP